MLFVCKKVSFLLPLQLKIVSGNKLVGNKKGNGYGKNYCECILV